jgi:Bacterial Ig domain/Polysaccharide deacetylase
VERNEPAAEHDVCGAPRKPWRRRVLLAVIALAGAAALASPAGAAIDVSIGSPPDGAHSLSGVVPVSVTASADQGIFAVQLYVDGQPSGIPDETTVGPYQYSIPWDTSTVSVGTHTLSVLATDWSSASATLMSATITVDVGPAYPTIALTSPAAWTFVRGSVPLEVTTTSASAPATVAFTLDGNPVTSPWDTTTAPDGPHTIQATITDGRGKTATASAQVTVDNTPPETYLLAPAASGYFTGSLPVQAHASDAYGIGSVQFEIDGTPSGGAITAPDTAGGYTYSASLSLAGLANGPHTLTEVATDNAGNATTSAPVAFNVGIAPLSAATITVPGNWTFAAKTITVTAAATGGTAPLTATLLVDGVASTLTPAISGSTITFQLDTATLADGSHTLAVAVTDAVRAKATSPAVTVTVDNTAPTAVMYQPIVLPGFTYARTNGPTMFQVHASDAYGIRSVQFTVDGSPVGLPLTAPDAGQQYLYTLNFDTSTLAAGMHTVSAIVTDNAGNVTTAPSLSLKSGPLVYLPVLNYHGIEGPLDTEPDIYDQTAAEADAQLAYLKANGYQSVTLSQYETWLATGALPAGVTKPVLITVDDGLTDEEAWDPLLQKYGFTAVLFVVTGFADNTTPGSDDPTGNMSWKQIQTYAANGRWQIAFHAGEYGHGDYSEAANTINLGGGQVESFTPACFTYYNCLGTITTTTTTGSGRNKKTTVTTAAETAAQFETQVKAEVSAGLAELKKEVPSADLTAWACPWNACGQWTNFYNDPSGVTQAWMPGYFASLFPIVFTQTDPITYGLASGTVGPLNGDNRRYRFEVHTDTTIAQFAAALTDPAFANN